MAEPQPEQTFQTSHQTKSHTKKRENSGKKAKFQRLEKSEQRQRLFCFYTEWREGINLVLFSGASLMIL